MTIALLTPQAAAFVRIKALVLDGLGSLESRRAYSRALDDFLGWCQRQNLPPAFTKALVQRYRTELEGRGLSPATVNLRLSAIRKLALEAADNGLMPPELAAGIARVKGAKQQGTRTGKWLTLEQADAPDADPAEEPAAVPGPPAPSPPAGVSPPFPADAGSASGPPELTTEGSGFGKPGGPIRPPLRAQTHASAAGQADPVAKETTTSERAGELHAEMRRVAARLAKRFPDEIRTDPKRFKRRAVTALRQALPPSPGRPAQAAVTLALKLRQMGKTWPEIYPLCIAGHRELEPATGRRAESSLRSACRSRRNARRRRRRRKGYLVTSGPQPSRPASAPRGPSAADASGAGG
jgi:hypothetical protein